ncbi:MAG: radical SAM protein [Treponemataceae bacterium]|nr:radical SAM protein [Treponemataceae bacterium]
MSQVEKKIDPKKQYKFPQNISIVRHNSKILVIAVDVGNWIVLENDNQLDFFYLLKENTLEKSLELFKGEQKDAVEVVTQLEARRFENQVITKTDKKMKTMIYLTDGCNMRCPHCYMYAGRKKENELTFDEIVNFLMEFKERGGEVVTYSGGEVTTREDFSAIINKTFELGIKCHVFTNGTLWTDELIKELSPKIDEIQISIDGYCEEENARVRGKGNFEKALKTVDKFVNAGVKTSVAITPFFDESLESKVDSYIQFTNSLIEKYNDKKFEIIISGSLLKGREVNLSKEENVKYKNLTDRISMATTQKFSEKSFVYIHRNFIIYDNCSFGNTSVSSTGEIYACSRLSELKPFANLRTDSFDKIFAISEKAKFVSNVDNLEPCNKCHLKYICGGGCRLVNFENINEACYLDSDKVITKKCHTSEKEFFYDLMIKSNTNIFH